MTKHSLLFLTLLLISAPAFSQTSKIKKMKNEHAAIQKKIKSSERLLKTTKTDMKSQLSNLALLDGKISERTTYITTIQSDVDKLNTNIKSMQGQIKIMQRDLADKKLKYELLMKYMYKHRTIQDKLMFVFSAQSMTQIYRRLRYVREYSDYLKAQAMLIEKRENEVAAKKGELLVTKNEKDNLIQQGMVEKNKLEGQKQEREVLVGQLKQREKSLQKTIAQQKQKAAALNAQIDRLVAAEIAAAKKREEARKKAEAKALAEKRAKEAQRRLAEAKAAEEKARARELASKSAAEKAAAAKKTAEAKAATKAAEAKVVEEKKAAKMENYHFSNADMVLAGSLEKNKGRLPMPITGGYVIVGHQGQHSVAGLKNVNLDNKGIDIKGQPGAQARSIFNGEVSEIFTLWGRYNILVRHGSYISVYCNLSSVSVKKGQHVFTRTSLGRVAADESGNYILHFQLRKEIQKLNPEAWLAR